MVKSGFHMPSLDGIRALSFGLVFLAHAGVSLGLPVPGSFGVTVFFFLSGFLITTLLRQEFERAGRVSFKKFYLRRVLRILPPFYLVLALGTAASLLGLVPGSIDWRALLAQVLHYANYWIIGHTYVGLPMGTGVYWSLAVEEHFYLLFPWLFLLLVRTFAGQAERALALLALCALLLVWRLILVYVLDVPSVRTELGSDTRFDSLLFGCALALFENPALDRSRVPDTIWKYVLFPLGLFVLLVTFLIRDVGFRDSVRYTLQGLGLTPVFVCAVRYPEWLPMRPLNFRPIAFVGALSYSLYLVHQIVLAILVHSFPWRLPEAQLAVLGFFGSLLVSWLIYIAIERPCAELRRKLHA
jgi:peptidoglycan/LPS O-acetylase OafA/YrhL